MSRSLTFGLLFLLLLPGVAFAQGKYMLTVSAGYSLPLGNYADLDTNNSKSGYANGGFLIQGSFDRIGKHGLGLGFSYIFQSNSLDPEVDSVMPDGHSFYLGSGSWNNHYLLAGPAYYKKWDRIILEASVRAGFILAMSSNFWVTLPAEDTLSQPRLSKGMGTGFAIQLRVGAGFSINEKTQVTLSVSYLYGAPVRNKDFYGYTYYLDPVTGYTPQYYGGEFTIKKKISAFNPQLGIIFKL